MEHIEFISNKTSTPLSNPLIKRLSGKYYTHKTIATYGINALLDKLVNIDSIKSLNIIDPFAGDGRLVCWFIEEWRKRDYPTIDWNVSLWDLNAEGLSKAEKSLINLKTLGFKLDYSIKCLDSFRFAFDNFNIFDIVITNPPWEILKPDRRELSDLSTAEKGTYKTLLKNYDSYISTQYPLSQPLKKFAGWGTNLSRV